MVRSSVSFLTSVVDYQPHNRLWGEGVNRSSQFFRDSRQDLGELTSVDLIARLSPREVIRKVTVHRKRLRSFLYIVVLGGTLGRTHKASSGFCFLLALTKRREKPRERVCVSQSQFSHTYFASYKILNHGAVVVETA
jgi:hypothetical protein